MVAGFRDEWGFFDTDQMSEESNLDGTSDVHAPDQEAQVRAYKRLDLACICFRQVIAVAEHLLQLGIGPQMEKAALYSGCMAGIVVTYAKPFVSANGLGELHGKYERGFPSELLAEAHRDLLEFRNILYAHRDLLKAASIQFGNACEIPAFESIIVIGRSSKNPEKASIRSEPCLPDISEADLPSIIDLCNFQLGRIGKDAIRLLENMAGPHCYAPGIYVVGKNYP